MQKTVLITGATQGIGLATTKRLIKHGYKVVGIARNTTQDFPGELLQADLAHENEIKNIFKKVAGRYEISAIVNNVGRAVPGYIKDNSVADFHISLNLNLLPALLSAQMFVDGMKERGWGRIINIASRAILGLDDRGVYSAAKAALIGFTRSWALELATASITVNAIAPGPIETERYRLHRPVGSAAEKKSLGNVPMGRIGKPEEIAATIEFLLSEDAGFITGQTIYVDGGASIGRVTF